MNIFELTPDGYSSHALHAADRDFRETNCYVDVWIEVLHALGLEPLACLGFTIASDFEGDQWTFYKPPHGDLERLYGVRVEELSLWRPLVEQIVTQVARKRLPLIEVDSYYLPDTAASEYRREHVKTTVAISAIDPVARRLSYFHNCGLHALEGEDFDGLLRSAPILPPYCEIIKPDRARAVDPRVLSVTARELAAYHFERSPSHNPIEAHAERFHEHLELIIAGGLPVYHGYSFVAMRQLGAAFELAASHVRWLGFASAADHFAMISSTAKMLILKLARVANTKRPSDLSAGFAKMAIAWSQGMERLGEELAS